MLYVVWSLLSPLFSGEFLRILLDRHLCLLEYSDDDEARRARGEEVIMLACTKDNYTDHNVLCEVMRTSRYQVSRLRAICLSRSTFSINQ